VVGGDGPGDEGVGGVGVDALVPISRSEGGRDEVDVILLSSAGCADATACRASRKRGGKLRPLFVALRKIPAAAFGVK